MNRVVRCGAKSALSEEMRARSVALLCVASLVACSGGGGGDGAGYVDEAESSYFGVVINANYAEQTPTREDLRRLGARWVRTIVYDGNADKIDAALRPYRCLGVKNLLLINQESFAPTKSPPLNPDDDAWETYAAVFADEAAAFVQAHSSIIDAVEIWNEPDIPSTPHCDPGDPLCLERSFVCPSTCDPGFVCDCAEGDAHACTKTACRQEGVAAERFALVVYKSYPRLKAILGDRPVIQGAVAGSDWPGYLNAASSWLAERGVFPDGAGFHPYGKSSAGYPDGYGTGDLQNAIDAAWITTNQSNPAGQAARPIWVTEFSLAKNEAPGGSVAPYVTNAYARPDQSPSHVMDDLQREGKLAHAFWFAWDDRVGTPDEIAAGKLFGLVERDGSPRALRDSGRAYRDAAGELPACGTDSGSGVDGSKSLADLSDAEKGAICDWVANALGGYGQVYACDGSDVSIAKSDRAACVASIPPACSATVAQVENCANAIGGDVCQVLVRPECAPVRHCNWQ